MTAQLRAWTYVAQVQPTFEEDECAKADARVLEKARRDVPAATAKIVGHRHTATGRHAITVHRTRPDPEPAGDGGGSDESPGAWYAAHPRRRPLPNGGNPG